MISFFFFFLLPLVFLPLVFNEALSPSAGFALRLPVLGSEGAVRCLLQCPRRTKSRYAKVGGARKALLPESRRRGSPRETCSDTRCHTSSVCIAIETPCPGVHVVESIASCQKVLDVVHMSAECLN